MNLINCGRWGHRTARPPSNASYHIMLAFKLLMGHLSYQMRLRP